MGIAVGVTVVVYLILNVQRTIKAKARRDADVPSCTSCADRAALLTSPRPITRREMGEKRDV
jgi:hypothetical protein